MNRTPYVGIVLVAVAPALFAWSPFAPKVSYDRLIPAPHNLGPMKKFVLIESRGNTDQANKLASDLIDYAQKRHVVEILDGRDNSFRLSDLVGNKEKTAAAAKHWPEPDALLSVQMESCNTDPRSETTQEKDKKGNKTTKTEYWVTASCTADLRIIDAANGRELVSAESTGDGTSIKASSRYSYMTDDAVKDAVNTVALRVFDEFVPRRDRQTLVLEGSAPSFRQANDLIKQQRYADARTTWETTLASNASSAPLHLDLAEVDEVMGDSAEAKKHYEEAARLNPTETYQKALAEFQKRWAEDESLKKRP